MSEPSRTPVSLLPPTLAALRLVEIGREFHRRGWALGTSGNLSVVTGRAPLRLAITPRGADKGSLSAEQILTIDGDGAVKEGSGRPSDETRLHLRVIGERQAGAVLHTHSVWNTLVSERHAERGGLTLSGFEMLKGLSGVTTHEHAELVPIVENSQEEEILALRFGEALAAHPSCHAVLIRGHGLTTWGRDLEEARRHVEVLEFLFEVAGRSGAGPVDAPGR